MSEVLSHFRSSEEVRKAFVRFAEALAPGAEDCPPTGWFEDWANGLTVFDMSSDWSAPIELRGLVFRRHSEV